MLQAMMDRAPIEQKELFQKMIDAHQAKQSEK